MAIKINSNKESEYEDGQLKDALLSLVLSALVVSVFFLLIFIAFLCLGFTAGQAALIVSLVLIVCILGVPGVLLAFCGIGVILLFCEVK